MAHELLLHIGYPKTATTTLQEEIFLKLHNLGKINYLGRTVTSTHNKWGMSRFNGNDLVVKMRRNLLFGEKFKFDSNSLSKDKINVISDEDLLFHDFFHSNQFGVSVDHFTFPDKIKNMFEGKVEVRILLTLRNQTDLIFSCFSQKINSLPLSLRSNSFYDFLINKTKHRSRSIQEHLRLYDFHSMKRLWERDLSKKISYLFFEDIIHDKTTFLSSLAGVLKVSPLECEECLGSRHHRKKNKSGDFVIRYSRCLSLVGRLFGVLSGNHNFLFLLEKRYYIRYSLYIKYESRLLMRNTVFKVGLPSEDEKLLIKLAFTESNIKWPLETGVDIKKLKAYNYIS